VHLGGIDVTAHDLRAEGLGEMETGLHRGIGMVGIIHWYIDGLIHQSASSKALSGQRAKGHNCEKIQMVDRPPHPQRRSDDSIG
jgi:hypothetical protein